MENKDTITEVHGNTDTVTNVITPKKVKVEILDSRIVVDDAVLVIVRDGKGIEGYFVPSDRLPKKLRPGLVVGVDEDVLASAPRAYTFEEELSEVLPEITDVIIALWRMRIFTKDDVEETSRVQNAFRRITPRTRDFVNRVRKG